MDPDVNRELSERVEYLQRRVEELERAEDRHRRSEELLEVLASFPKQNPNPIIETDLQGKVSYMNPAAREVFPELQNGGFDHPLLMGLAAIIRGFEERASGAEHGGDSFQREVGLGEAIYQQRIVFLADNNLVRIFANDVSEIKRTEAKLVRLASFPEQNPDPVVEIDLDGGLTYLNPIAREKYPDLLTKGLSHPLLEGIENLIDQLRKGDHRSIQREREVRGSTYNQKFVYMPESELIRVYNNDITALKELQNQIQGSLAELEVANRNLNEAQVQLVQSEKMASLGKLVAGIAHEINTPIGAIYSAHDTLIRARNKLVDLLGDAGNERIDSVLQVISDVGKVVKDGSERVVGIVNSMRSFARLDEAELKRVDIHDGLEDTLKLIQHEFGERIELIKSFSEVPEVVCYPGRLNQALVSLLLNACQAIRGTGTIELATEVADGNVLISVRDSGEGISPENLQSVFEPGYTTKGVGVGTGLGLSICYQVMQDHQGQIRIESEVGKGTTVTCLLPLKL